MQKLIKPYTILILYVEKVCCLILWHVATLFFFFNLRKLNKDIPEYQMDLLVTMRAGIKITVGYRLQPTKNK